MDSVDEGMSNSGRLPNDMRALLSISKHDQVESRRWRGNFK